MPLNLTNSTRLEQPFADVVKTVDFPAFIGGLIKGVFQANVDSSIQQMRAYIELIADVAKTTDQFMNDNISEAAGSGFLAESYPYALVVDTRSMRIADANAEWRLVAAARLRLAKSRQHLLSFDGHVPDQPDRHHRRLYQRAGEFRHARQLRAPDRASLTTTMPSPPFNRLQRVRQERATLLMLASIQALPNVPMTVFGLELGRLAGHAPLMFGLLPKKDTCHGQDDD